MSSSKVSPLFGARNFSNCTVVLRSSLLMTIFLFAACGPELTTPPESLDAPEQTTFSGSVTKEGDSYPPSSSTSGEGATVPLASEKTDVKDATGAVATAELFLERYNYVLKSGDESPLIEMSLDTCTFCSDTVHRLKEQRRQQLTQIGGELTWKYVGVPLNANDLNVVPVQFEVIETAVELRDSSNKTAVNVPGSAYVVEVDLSQSSGPHGIWKVVGVRGHES